MAKNGTVVLECYQEIPCDPCVDACPQGAIHKESLNKCPSLDDEKCTGCKLCIAACPGQAIFFLSQDYNDDTGEITFPYEFTPLPNNGDIVDAVDRKGSVITQAKVIRVKENSVNNKTAIITLKIPARHLNEVRFMKRLPRKES